MDISFLILMGFNLVASVLALKDLEKIKEYLKDKDEAHMK